MQSPQARKRNRPEGRPRLSLGLSRQNLLSLYLPALVLSLGTGIAAPVLPIFARTFNVSFEVASLIIIVQLVGGVASTIPTGYLVDHFGRRKVLLGGPILTAISSFLVASARSFPQLLVYRFIGGWGQQMWMISRLVVIADTGAARERGRQITGMAGLGRVGSLLGPAIGGFTAAAWGIRVPFVIHGILAIISVIPSFALVKETAPARVPASAGSARQAAANNTYSYRELLVYPVLVLFVAQVMANVIRGAGGQAGGGPLFLYAVYAYDIGPATLGVLATIGAFIGVPLIFLAGQLMDRFGRKAGVVPGTSLLGAGMLYLAVSSYLNWPFAAFVAGFIWANTTVSLMTGSMQTMGSDVAPAHARGKFFGVQRLLGELGMLLSPVSFALVFKFSGFPAAFLFMAIMGFATALWITVMIKDTFKIESREGPSEDSG